MVDDADRWLDCMAVDHTRRQNLRGAAAALALTLPLRLPSAAGMQDCRERCSSEAARRLKPYLFSCLDEPTPSRIPPAVIKAVVEEAAQRRRDGVLRLSVRPEDAKAKGVAPTPPRPGRPSSGFSQCEEEAVLLVKAAQADCRARCAGKN